MIHGKNSGPCGKELDFMARGSKEGIEGNSSFSDGEIFTAGIRRFKDICKAETGRVVPSKRMLREIGATESSLVGWEVENGSVFIFGLDPDQIKNELKISKKEGMIIAQYVDELDKLEPCPDGDIHIIQVKSQGRVGTKNQVKEILHKAGIGEDDLLIPMKVDKKVDGRKRFGWRLYGFKKKDFLFFIKKKEKKNAVVSSS